MKYPDVIPVETLKPLSVRSGEFIFIDTDDALMKAALPKLTISPLM